MRIKLVFDDWRKYNLDTGKQESVYGSSLSYGNFHSGTTFKAIIELELDDAKELKEALKSGAFPVFYGIPDN
jgi:hypothetical protein